MANKPLSIAFLGATGAVGTEALQVLLEMDTIEKVSLFGRRDVADITDDRVHQYQIDIFTPATYESLLPGHNAAVCTLGVGQPSKMSKEDFIKIDKLAVLDFAKACKVAGVAHFELLSSVGIDADSRSFFLRAKGELVEALKALEFERLSIFQPSMILTPTNRYGFMQGITLAVWPLLTPLLGGGLKKYRGIKVEQLGRAIARNLSHDGIGIELLTWEDFQNVS